MKKYMFYCPVCESVYSGDVSPTMIRKCPDCNADMVSMMITKDEWDTKTKEQKADFKAKIKESSQIIGSNLEYSMAEDIHKMAMDIHFMKVVLQIYVILCIVGIIYIGISL